jgi:hypothetical protein
MRGIITIHCVTEWDMLCILGFHQVPSTQNKGSNTMNNRSHILAPIKMKDESTGKSCRKKSDMYSLNTRCSILIKHRTFAHHAVVHTVQSLLNMSVTSVPCMNLLIYDRQQVHVTYLTEHNFKHFTTISNNKRGRILTQNP